MLLCDVNVLVYAHRRDAERHLEFRSWLDGVVNGAEAYGYVDLVVSGFVRVVTHPRIFRTPSPLSAALEFAEQIRSASAAVALAPGPRHWELFTGLCRAVNARGNLVPDAFLAALAIESGSELVTTDRDFARFPDLRWRHPLDA